VPGDTNNGADVFVRDRVTGTTTLVSLTSTGAQAAVGSDSPAISTDGRYVALVSSGANVVVGDTNNADDVFVRDRTAGTTTLVSVSRTGDSADAESSGAAISADGRYVGFSSPATNLVAGDTNGTYDVFLRDLLAGTTSRVSVRSDGAQGNALSGFNPGLSADARYIAFTSNASNLVSGDTNGTGDTFVRDRVAGTTTRVSVSSAGRQANHNAGGESISGDGRFVAFVSRADLVPGDTNRDFDVFVRDRRSGTTSRVSVSGTGAQANARSTHAAISADGQYVVFESLASNLVAGDTNGTFDVFVRNRLAGVTNRVSVAADGTQSGGSSRFSPTPITAHGRSVVFETGAPLVPSDTNGTYDIFVRDRRS